MNGVLAIEDVDLGEGLRVIDTIGQGSSGIVYLAEDERDGTRFAVKHFERSHNRPVLPFQEMSILTECRNPHLVQILDARYLRNGDILICYEYISGGSLRERLEVCGRLSFETALELCDQVLFGLDAIHSHRILHCDVKPENILIDQIGGKETYKLSDLGSALLLDSQNETRAGRRLAGSPAYMAPERFFDTFGVNSDLYSLGVILFEALTGDRPFSGPPEAVARAHFADRPPVERIEHPLFREFVAALMEKKPGIRPGNANQALRLKHLIFGTGREDASSSNRDGASPHRPTRTAHFNPDSEWKALSPLRIDGIPGRMLCLVPGGEPHVVIEHGGTAIVWHARQERIVRQYVLGPERVLRDVDDAQLAIATFSGIEIVHLSSDSHRTLLSTSGLVWDLDGDTLDGRFVAAIENRLLYLDDRGETLWRIPYPRYGFGQHIRLRPGNEGAVLSLGPLHNRIVAIDASGTTEWETPVPGPVTQLTWWNQSAYALVVSHQETDTPTLFRVTSESAEPVRKLIGSGLEILKNTRRPTLLRAGRYLENCEEGRSESLAPPLPSQSRNDALPSQAALSWDLRSIVRASLREDTTVIETFVR